MNGKLPRATAKEVEKAVIKTGYYIVRQSGSHRVYRNQEKKRITLPIHPGKVIHPKIIKKILVENNLSVKTLKKLMK